MKREFITKKLDYSKFSDYPGEHEIILEFKVEKDGSLSSYQFRQLPDPVFAEEIKRVMKEFGNWNPRYAEEKRVSTKIKLKFRIEVDE